MTIRDVQQLGTPLTPSQIIWRDLRAIENRIHKGGATAADRRQAEKLKRRLANLAQEPK